MKTINGNVWVIQLKVIGVIAVIRDTKSGEWYWFRRWATEYGRFHLGVNTSFAETTEQKFKIVHEDWDGKGRDGLDNFIASVCRFEVPEATAFSFASDEPPPAPKRQRLTCETHQATTRYYYRHELCDACGECAACGWTKAELEVKATSGSDLYWGCRGERWKEFETRWKVSTDAAESFAALNAALCESKKAIEALAAAPDGLNAGDPQRPTIHRTLAEFHAMPLDELKREWQHATEEASAARRDIGRLGSFVNQDQKDYYNEKLRGAIDAGNRYLCALRVALGNG